MSTSTSFEYVSTNPNVALSCGDSQIGWIFQIRDAELVIQAIEMIRERMHLKDIEWQDVFLDAFTRAIIGTET